MNPKVDYAALEREYISGSLSIRALAAKHGMSWGSVAVQYRKRGWKEKRIAFRSKASDKMIERDSTKMVQDTEALEFEQIQAARAIIFAGLEAIRNKEVTVQPRDMMQAADVIQRRLGKDIERSEVTVVGQPVPVAGPDPEFLRRLEELSRGVLDDAPRVAGLRLTGTKPN